ncbi:hypothetical protein BKA59DRAFT_495910 [Fusarium tricinctum]|uniref:BTB domain-containing protein n=1 Tax=Fusarium tricinctum TaxID=61284 RepID=A0A8K0W6W5_9HYPO|nr:hypothetical protein BKA59DRAFT_495910 [Fusarium tricinctum]
MALQSHAFLFSLVGSGEYSDFTLLRNGHEFKLYQVIVCPQSLVLTAALSGGFQKTTSKIITVNEFHIELAEDETVEDLLSHLRVNAIADYYNIQNLTQLANSQIRVILEKGQNANVFPRVIQEVLTSDRDPDVCSIIASAAATCAEELSELQAFQEVELKHNLSMEILRACSKRIQTLQHRLDVAQHNAAIYRGFRDDEAGMKTSFIEQIDKYMDLLKQTYGCCHCAKGFGCYFEKKYNIAVGTHKFCPEKHQHRGIT